MPLFRSGSGQADAPLPYPPRSPEGLAARWVRWAAAHSHRTDPIADTTGEHAGHHQPADVWFLAGSYGDAVLRRCPVPANRPLFFPVINMWAWTDEPGAVPELTEADGKVRLDDEAVPLTPVGTPTPFEVRGGLRNGVTGRRRPRMMTVWGLWASVEPPAPGEHELVMRGTDGHGFEVRATYQLTVG